MEESTSPEPESRPTRSRARRLTEEQLQAMLNSDSEYSDDDPDFEEETVVPKRRSSVRRPQSSQDSSESSEEVDEPDGPSPRKKAVKAKGEPVKKKNRTAGEEGKGGPKRSSSWAPVSDVPPPIENPHLYSSWNNESKVVEPSKKSDDKTYYCCVRDCESGDTSDKEGLWLFSMPENEELMSLWDERLPIDYDRNRPQSPRVCFRHFEKADFVRRQQRLLGLREDAIPLKVEPRVEGPRIKQEPS
ncbi:uncharacterized protein LOC119180350 isoform X3 [Rhipicephalus microplus]|uniref:uncharacterized protein LOC119180350 isoform X3 n=1 Tax=Rhipicephalus microplus TaxID=6941 RepID=UPI003F6DA43D